MHLVVIKTNDHQNFHFGLFCIPNHHLVNHKLLQNSLFFFKSPFNLCHIYVQYLHNSIFLGTHHITIADICPRMSKNVDNTKTQPNII